MEEISHGRFVHAVVLSCEGEASVGVMNALINMYGKHSRVSEARKTFASICKSHRDVISWNSMIAAYARNGRLQEAKDTFDAMDLDRNTVTWNTMIGGYAQSESAGAGALIMLALMDQQGIHPNACTFISVFDACARISALRQGRLVHSLLLEGPGAEDHSQHHLEVGNSIIHMYGSCGCSAGAEETLHRMQSRTVVSWSSLVAAHVQAGDLSSAVTSFHKMAMDGVLPNEVTFLALLSALGHSGDVKRGWSFFISMHHDYGLVWGIDHLVCTVDLFGRAGLIEQAERIVLSSSFARSPVPWMALLSACKSSRNPGTIEKSGTVARTALELNTAKSSPYVLVSNAFLDDLSYFPGARTLPYQPPPPAAPLVKTHLG
ncbi:pentatricopeptide repeat-containing protein At2g13600 [Selaginella moellendorffii]|uniref:pentatricopeptide repeat-containing protein At2g13600 n=1 Tax=Selaginella moellendorffii TaxID=88036 RepID=UPI000D1C8F62|nr:pentatricopeptide repeat-containing protein At2g13600 [Selaginella moellendorffii]|eukprot:XP_024517695.1 pentatricopeptide repeat-containing protein At2g13600 [Selaginella moellendorffii]